MTALLSWGAPFRGWRAVYRRELAAYFRTPMAYVFIVVFLIALGAFTWETAAFFDSARADLSPFFLWHPWLYMIFLPAIAMRLWADERAYGTDELLFSLPIGMAGAVLGKQLAGWTLAGVALACTLPMWATVNYLGPADNSAIALAYAMSFLMAGGYVAIGAAASALSGNQVTAFVLGVVVAFLHTAAGWPVVLAAVAGVLGEDAAAGVARFSFLTHFEAAQRGVLELRSVLYFVSVAGVWSVLSGLWAARGRMAGA